MKASGGRFSGEEWQALKRELLGNAIAEPGADIRNDIRQQLLVVWSIVCWYSKNYDKHFTPRHAVSAAWLGVQHGLRTYQPGKLALRRFLLLTARLYVHRELVDHLNRSVSRSRPAHVLMSDITEPVTKRPGWLANWPGPIESEEVEAAVYRWESMIADRPEEHSKVLTLFYVHGLTDREIAERLNMSKDTARSWIQKARIAWGVDPGVYSARGRTKPVTPCLNCGSLTGPFRKGRCGSCRTYFERTGRERPYKVDGRVERFGEPRALAS